MCADGPSSSWRYFNCARLSAQFDDSGNDIINRHIVREDQNRIISHSQWRDLPIGISLISFHYVFEKGVVVCILAKRFQFK